jgi:hypothetical protein
VEKLEGDELYDFHQQVVLGLGDCDDSVCTSIPQDLDFMSSDEAIIEEEISNKRSSKLSKTTYDAPVMRKTSLPQYASCTDLDMTEDELEAGDVSINSSLRGSVPCPKQITFEPQQNR